jgi:hypothetical protein
MSMKAFGITTKQLPIENGGAKNLNLNVRGLHESVTFSIRLRCQELQSSGAHIVNFFLGQCHFQYRCRSLRCIRIFLTSIMKNTA